MRRLGEVAQEILVDGAGILHIQAETALKEMKLLLNANDKRCLCRKRGGEYIKEFLEHCNSYIRATEKSQALVAEIKEHFASYNR